MRITHKMVYAAKVGDRIGPWVKLDIDHTGQVNTQLKGDLRPWWAHVETGQVRHSHWILTE